jgi:aminoglycoside/choline kinase family phosphotransferase
MNLHFLDKKIVMQNQQQFSQWIEQSLPDEVDIPCPMQLDALAGDAGFRRYYRTNTYPSLIAVNSPPAKEKNWAYVDISLFLKSQGIKTPKIHAVNFELGYFLLEDFGPILFAQKIDNNSKDRLYDQAEQALLQIQQATEATPSIPCHDGAKLHEEMALFERWFLNELLEIKLNDSEKKQLNNLFQSLVESALEQPQVMVHTDYHSRNLMILADETLGVIDFQDAMYGAITYDLVSLLKDCYVKWPSDWVAMRVARFKQHPEVAARLSAVDDKQFLQWFDFMGLQRHIKVLGIFARLALRDSKSRYLNDLPLVIDYCLEASERYPQTLPFNHWLKQKILPLVIKMPWYKTPSGEC